MEQYEESIRRRKPRGLKKSLPEKLDRSCRIVKNLRSAQMITDPPSMFSKQPKLRGAKGKGLTYERHVGRTLKRWAAAGQLHGDIRLGQWFSFHDENGHGYCQTDILVVTSSLVFILECKLTFTDW